MMKKVLIRQFLSQSHSWAKIGQGVGRSLIKSGYSVDLFPTDGMKYLPDDLKKNVIGYWDEKSRILNGNMPVNDYDVAFSYTAPHNWSNYTSGAKKKLVVWCWEWAGKSSLPIGFAKNHSFVDYIMPPSQFAKEVFLDSGVPAKKMVVIPHAIDDIFFEETRPPIKLKTNKRVKLVAAFGQIHLRKNIPAMLTAYGKAFTNSDDICFVIKATDKKPEAAFEVSFRDILKDFKFRFPNHAEILVLTDFVPEMDSLYRACDIHFSMTHTESFGIPFWEAASLGLVNVMPRYGGMLDFFNDNNSLMVEGKMTNAPPTALYWQQRSGLQWFDPSIDDAVEKLRYAYENVDMLKAKFDCRAQIKERYNWDRITSDIMALTK
jgi:glycosyltransferase involved in cell wall biosynthesis